MAGFTSSYKTWTWNINSTFSVYAMTVNNIFFCSSLLVNQAAPTYTQITGSVSVMWCWHFNVLFFSLSLYCILKHVNPFFLNLFFIFPSFWMEALSGWVPNFLAVMHVSMCKRKKLVFQSNNIKHTLCASIVPQKNMLFIILQDL